MLTKTHVVHIWIFGYLNGPIMLIDLLGDGLSYEAEVFVDDKTTNINNMTKALSKPKINFYDF